MAIQTTDQIQINRGGTPGVANSGIVYNAPVSAFPVSTLIQASITAASNSNRLYIDPTLAPYNGAPDNATDNTSAIAAAITAAANNATSGSGPTVVLLRDGIWRFSQITSLPTGVALLGQSKTGTILRTTSASTDIITVTGFRNRLSDFTMDCTVARTAGSYIVASSAVSSIVEIDNIVMKLPCIGITTSATLAYIHEVAIDYPVATIGIGIQVNDGYILNIDKVIVRGNPSSRDFAHLVVSNVQDMYLTNCQFLSGGNNIKLVPGTGQNINLFHMRGGGCDDVPSAESIRIVPTGNGSVREVDIDTPWCYGTPGVLIDASFTTGSVDTVRLANILMPGTGEAITATGVKNLLIDGIKAGQHTIAIDLINVAGGLVTNCLLGPHGSYGANTTGLRLYGSCANVGVYNNKIIGNTTNIDISSLTGTSCEIKDNMGFPALGNSAQLTPTASPYTHVCGPSPETIFVNGGVVSLISVNGVNMLQTSNHAIPLAPNQSIIITYSTVPTVVIVKN